MGLKKNLSKFLAKIRRDLLILCKKIIHSAKQIPFMLEWSFSKRGQT